MLKFRDMKKRSQAAHLTPSILTWFYVVLLITFSFLLLTRDTALAAPETFTVTNTNDSGDGSLRAAILAANDNNNPDDMDVIEFDIPGDGVHTISLESGLPAITEKVTIDGYSQTGAAANTAIAPSPLNGTIRIEIVATTSEESALEISADESVISGLSIRGAKFAQIFIGANDVKISGNYLQIDAQGTFQPLEGTDSGINCQNTASGAQIGGTDPRDRNVIAGEQTTGRSAVMLACTDSFVKGNFIGVAPDGVTKIGNYDTTISVGSPGQSRSTNNVIGGPDTGEANVIANAKAVNIVIFENNNIVQGNFIASDYQGNAHDNFSKGGGVTMLLGASNNLIGGTSDNEGNTIAGIGGFGISVIENSLSALDITAPITKNTMLRNSIRDVAVYGYLDLGEVNLGIDLLKTDDSDNPPDSVPNTIESAGPTQNDEGDTDTGPNGFINTPVLKTAQQVGNQLTITYDLDAADSPSDTYRVEFFASNSRTIFGNGPGEIYLGAADSVAPGTDKTVTLTVGSDLSNKALSATTTAIDNTTDSGFGSTSEFAQNISIGSVEDFDADGVPDEVEDAAPNNGDGNNDGIPDKVQPTVTSYVTAAVNGSAVYATFLTEGCSENGTVSSLAANSLQVKDNGYEYPYGLTDFTLYCSRGDTVNVTMYVHTQDEPRRFIPRKFNLGTNTFTDIPGSNLTSQVLGASTALKLTYSVTDGGDLDDDATENGVIVDPVGLASESSGVLANTGFMTGLAVAVGFLLLVGVIYTYTDYRKHKKPLQEADPFLASNYTYWHHLRVVTVPLAKYRFSISIEKKEKLASPPQLG